MDREEMSIAAIKELSSQFFDNDISKMIAFIESKYLVTV